MVSRRAVRFQTSLIGNMAALVLLLGALLLVTSLLTTRRAVEDLSASLTKRVLDLTDARLHGFFEPVQVALGMSVLRAKSGAFDLFPLDDLDAFFVPLIANMPQVSSVLFAHEDGSEYMLLQTKDGWRSRLSRPAWDGKVTMCEWGVNETEKSRTSVESDYDARTRPWHVGGLERWRRMADAPIRERIAWTEPYRFFTTGEPGITASLGFETQAGAVAVLGMDILLSDVSHFTTDLLADDGGKVFVLRGDPENPDEIVTLGLPADDRFDDAEVLAEMVLCKPSELGGPVAAFLEGGVFGTKEPLRFQDDGRQWWGAMVPSTPTSENVWVGTVVPESALLDDVPDTARIVVLATLGFVLVAVLRSLRVARLYAQPLLGLVQRGERMQRLDFRATEPAESHVKEVQLLSATLEAARATLDEYSSETEDLRVARSVRALTLPAGVPVVSGWEFAAWHEPGEDVDGEVHDAVLSGDGRLAFFVADLPGAGVATALDGAQLRAAFRACASVGGDAIVLAGALDRFVAEDLSLRRSVPAWIGLLTPETGDVQLVGPSGDDLLMQPREGAARRVAGSDGGLGSGAVPTAELLTLEDGDALVFASDGLVDALDGARRRFGQDGVRLALGSAAGSTAEQLLGAVRDAAAQFDAARRRDRTLLVMRRA